MKTFVRPIALPITITLFLLLFVGAALGQTLLHGVVTRNANLRGGPGTTYAIVGGVKTGQEVTIVKTNAAGDWYQLDTGNWIAAFLVKIGDGGLPGAARPAPSPTITATVAVDQAALEKTYIDAIFPILNNYAAALSLVGTQMTAAGQDASLLFDEPWRLKTATALAALTALADQARALVPPARLSDIHKDFLTAAVHYEKVSTLIVNGIDQLNSEMLVQATNEMLLGNAAITRAQAKVQSLPTATPTTKAPTPIAPTSTPKPTLAANTDNTSTPATGEFFTCTGGCTEPPAGSTCVIKGNVNSKGERIYHIPDSKSYAKTNVNLAEGDRWFCTSTEAEAAGFRAPRN